MAQKYMIVPSPSTTFDAVQYTGSNQNAIVPLLDDPDAQMGTLRNGTLIVQTNDRRYTVVPIGAYLIRWSSGAVEVAGEAFLKGRMPAPEAVVTEMEKLVVRVIPDSDRIRR